MNLIFFILLIISFRVWQLCVLKHENKVQEALKPQAKVFVQPALRGGIYDRFGLPLAINKIQYQAGVFYSPIRQISSIEYRKDERGKKIKVFPRREHIAKLSQKLGEILHMDAQRVEDLIHAKASIRFDQPYILKENISEAQYYQLKMLEGQLPGVYAGIESKRHYPQGKVASSIIGYMGAINRQEYEGLIQERYNLEQFLKQWELGHFPPLPPKIKTVADARIRLKELKERCYSVDDWVGKSGIESSFDEALRGYSGRHFYYSDAKGQFFKPMSLFQKSFSGKKLTLTISAELQKFAEELLIENERIRRSIYINPVNGEFTYQKEPWIKGGAIVAIDPNNGEVIAMASCPRFDPNDFILSGDESQKEKKNKNVLKWLEGDSFIADVWDRKINLSKEIFDGYNHEIIEDEFALTWELFINLVLPLDSPVKLGLDRVKNLHNAIELQETFAKIFELSGAKHPFDLLKVIYKEPQHTPYPESAMPSRIARSIEKNIKDHSKEYAHYKKILDTYLFPITHNYDKLLLVDLCRLNVNSDKVNEQLRPFLDQISLSQHRNFETAYFKLEQVVKNMTQELFRKHHFKLWRDKHQKSFLKEKRKEEQINKLYPKPFIDHLDKEEARQFLEFWQHNKLMLIRTFLTGQLMGTTHFEFIPYLNHLTLWAKEIKHGAHSSVDWIGSYKEIEALLKWMSIEDVMNYFSVFRTYSELNRPLYGKYVKINTKKPIEQDLAKSFYPQHGFSYCRSYAFSQSTPQGSIFKLVTAYEALRQKHQQNPNASDMQLSPLTMVDDLHMSRESRQKWNVGYLNSGQPIPQFYKGGRLPRSRRRGIGKLDLKDAIAISSNSYFGLIVADILKSPEDLNQAASLFSFGSKTGLDIPGEISGKLPSDLSHNRTGLYAYSIGQHTLVVTPIQTALMLTAIANKGTVFKPQLVQSVEGIDLKQVNAAKLIKNEYDFKETLSYLGIDYPLFTSKERGETEERMGLNYEIHHHIEMPTKIQHYLFKSMYEIIHGKLGSAHPNKIRNYSPSHQNYIAYQTLKNQIIGKTSSAEIREAVDLDLKKGINTYKHVWFGGIVFEEDAKENYWPKPELVVVVFLRYGDFGREVAPLAASVAKKWREIKKQRLKESNN